MNREYVNIYLDSLIFSFVINKSIRLEISYKIEIKKERMLIFNN